MSEKHFPYGRYTAILLAAFMSLKAYWSQWTASSLVTQWTANKRAAFTDIWTRQNAGEIKAMGHKSVAHEGINEGTNEFKETTTKDADLKKRRLTLNGLYSIIFRKHCPLLSVSCQYRSLYRTSSQIQTVKKWNIRNINLCRVFLVFVFSRCLQKAERSNKLEAKIWLQWKYNMR